ncbi:hypothetical protein VC83_06083 [Pseudogymnoascus destructans]|uniref:Uncharacterized protein n=1 Tax=Pseudogymnoascus destructans TaxID=655981 RepID=A0A177ABW9_9PEZI|nr:uncharacterized protein VC83_06083 [Pseudogymnoascus destructans]OAF58771.1 hypothetical protein VC83_06083 [Pseudogymnoascus destructans]
MILSVYRKILQQQPHLIYIWDDLLPHVVNIINTWKVSVYGVSPAELLFGFKPRFVPGDLSIDEELRAELISQPQFVPAFEHEPNVSAVGIRLAKLDELRDMAMADPPPSSTQTSQGNCTGICCQESPHPGAGDELQLRGWGASRVHLYRGVGEPRGQVGHGRRREEEAEEAEEDEEEEENWGRGPKGRILL